VSPTLSLSEFRVWLSRQRRYRHFAPFSNCCPLARFLQARRGDGARVFNKRYFLPVKGSVKRSQHNTPVWAERFIVAFDKAAEAAAGMSLTVARTRMIFRQSVYRKP
jgi:hypothetical protein